MLKIEKTVLPSPEQWEIIIEGMRNPMNSHDRIDSYMTHIADEETLNEAPFEFFIGEADQELMETLAKAGSDHRKYLRMIPVWVTLTAPLYWWKEADQYKVGTVTNSCSTMHTIHKKEFTIDDFSYEHLLVGLNHYDERDVPYINVDPLDERSIEYSPLGVLEYITIPMLNDCRDRYLTTKNKPMKNEDARKELMKKYWWQMIQLLPSSYNQKRTWFLNYEVLSNIYHARKNHKLDEWKTLASWIENELPYSELITGKEVTE